MAYTNQQRHTEEKIRAMTKYQASSTVGAASIFAFRGAAQQHVFAAGVCLIVLSGVFTSRIIKADRKLKIMALPDPDLEATASKLTASFLPYRRIQNEAFPRRPSGMNHEAAYLRISLLPRVPPQL